MYVMTWYTSINYIVDTLSVFLVLKLYCIVKRYKRTKNIAVTFFQKFESLTNSAIALIMLDKSYQILKKNPNTAKKSLNKTPPPHPITIHKNYSIGNHIVRKFVTQMNV